MANDTAGRAGAEPTQFEANGDAKTLTALIKGDVRIALSILTGAVAISGLLNQVIFYRFFDISYVAYLGASDFLGLVLQTIPLTLVVVVAALATSGVAVVGAIYSRSGAVVALWRLGVALSLACRLLIGWACRLLGGTAAWLIQLAHERERAWSVKRLRRVAVAADVAQSLIARWMAYEPLCQRRARSSRCGWLRAIRARRRRLRHSIAFANEHYLEILSVVTIVTIALGFGFSAAAGYRLRAKLAQPQRQSDVWRQVDHAFSWFFPGFLVNASLNVGGLRIAIDDAVFLGATSGYVFFLNSPKSADAALVPLIVPAHEIELVALAQEVPSRLQKREKSEEAIALERQLDRLNESVAGVGERLDRTHRDLVSLGGLFQAVAAPRTLSPDCRDNVIKGIDFRFALDGSNPLADAPLEGPTAAVHAPEYQNVTVRAYNEVQRARLVDYVTTTQFGYLPGDYLLVEGHASAEASFGYNEELSEKRADAVVGYLRAAEIWDRVEAFRGSDVADAALEWQTSDQIRASFKPIGRGELDFRNDPYDPRYRRVLVYHCRPQPPASLRMKQAGQAPGTAPGFPPPRSGA